MISRILCKNKAASTINIKRLNDIYYVAELLLEQIWHNRVHEDIWNKFYTRIEASNDCSLFDTSKKFLSVFSHNISSDSTSSESKSDLHKTVPGYQLVLVE